MVNTAKYMGEIFHNDNLNKERIKKIEKQVIITCQTLQEYDGNPKIRKNGITSEMENIGSSNITNFLL